MPKRPDVFAEYSTVRIVKLIHDDRWSVEGTPSVGDEGTVVDVVETDDGVWYTVEHMEGYRTIWIADFSHDELAPGGELGSAHRRQKTNSVSTSTSEERRASRPAGRDDAHSPHDTSTETGREALVVVVSGLLGSISAVLLAHVLVPEGGWILPLALGAIFGLVGGLAGGTLVEAAVTAVLLCAVTAVLFAVTSQTLILSATVSFAGGAGVGRFTASLGEALLNQIE